LNDWLVKLYDESEDVKVRFVGLATEAYRYDFGIVHTNMFFGKTLVICMQTGRTALLDADDLTKLEHLQKSFQLPSLKEARDLSLFLEEVLPFSSSPEIHY
jgi:hypothetical protein